MSTGGLRKIGNRVLTGIGNARRLSYDTNRTIVLSGTGRGGTTWLAQLMSTLPGSLLLWEQLHFKTNPKSLDYGFGHPRYLSADYKGEQELAYIEYLLKGGELGTAIRSQLYFKPQNILRFSRYIHKFVNANMLLPWLTKNFGVSTVYIVRHPCAVVSSQLRHAYGAWEGFSKERCCHEKLFLEYPHLAKLYADISTKEECLAFDWAIQNFVPLKQGFNGITVFYEDLVDQPFQELEKIFAYLAVDMPKSIGAKINRPSRTAYQSSNNLVDGKADLSGWQAKLEDRQVAEILQVVSNAGIDLYGQEEKPLRRELAV